MSSEQEAIDLLLSLKEEELVNVSHTKIRMRCCIKDCNGYATVKDYGVWPLYRWKRKWWDLTKIVFYCGRHWKFFKRKFPMDYKPGSALNHLDKL